MSLDLNFYRASKSIPAGDIDACFRALDDYLSRACAQRGLTKVSEALSAEARLAALESTGLAEDFFERLNETLDRVPDESGIDNTYDLRIGSWCSVGSLSDELRTATGTGLEDLFPTAAMLPNALVLPDWVSVERALGEMRGKLVAIPPSKRVDDNRLASMAFAMADELRQAGFNLPDKAIEKAITLAKSTVRDPVNGERDELVDAVDAMAETIRHVLQDPSSRHFVVWSN